MCRCFWTRGRQAQDRPIPWSGLYPQDHVGKLTHYPNKDHFGFFALKFRAIFFRTDSALHSG